MLYRRDIDGLRAVAILPVIFFHAGLKLFSGGFVGIDIFFIISGFLIGTIILNDLDLKKFSPVDFYRRRFFRIFPAFIAVIFICILTGYFYLLPRDYQNLSESILASIFFVSNVYLSKTSGYFDLNSDLKPLLHTWSLSVEEQFYIIFPLIAFYLYRSKAGRFLFLITSFFIISLIISEVYSYKNPAASYYLLWSRFWQLMLGVIVALLVKRNYINTGVKYNSILSFIGFCLIIYSVTFFDADIVYPGLNALLPSMGVVLVIIFSNKDNLTGKLLGSKLFVFVGLISYSLYLWHQPLFAFSRHIWGYDLSPLMIMLVIFALLPIAYFSYYFIERPFRIGGSLSNAFGFVFLLTVTFIICLLALKVINTNGAENRSNLILINNGDVGNKIFYGELKKFPACQPSEIEKNGVTFEGLNRCRQSKRLVDPTIALVGDSHAEHLFPGLANKLPNENIAIYVNRTYPFSSAIDFQEIFDYIKSSKSIHTVIFGVKWQRYFDDKILKNNLSQELIETIRPIVSAGKKVILMGDIPIYSFSAESCKFNINLIDSNRCDQKLDDVILTQKFFMSELSKVQEAIPIIFFFNIRDLFCFESYCTMQINSSLLYRDEGHLSILGSVLVAEKMKPLFQVEIK